jgi:type IV pilus assembly protein PilW
MDAIVDVWDQTTPTTACELSRAPAVRLAIVARSSQPEKTLDWPALTTHVTQKERGWTDRVWAGTDDAAHAISSAAADAVAVTLPDPDPTWPTRWDFRYKVFQTTVPLRNITIAGARPEC